MKHQHSADVRIDIPTQELEGLVDKITDAALFVIAASTVSHILKSIINQGAS